MYVLPYIIFSLYDNMWQNWNLGQPPAPTPPQTANEKILCGIGNRNKRGRLGMYLEQYLYPKVPTHKTELHKHNRKRCYSLSSIVFKLSVAQEE